MVHDGSATRGRGPGRIICSEQDEKERVRNRASELGVVLPPDAGMAFVAERLVDQARNDGIALTGARCLLTGLVQDGQVAL